ncbi:MAG: DUF6559 family protein [Thiohalomonadales bacterium]
MGLIEKYKNHRAIKQYLKKLGPLLKNRYGKSKFYTEGQVRKTVEEFKLNDQYIEYALAMYMQPDECDGVLIRLGKSKRSRQLRKYIATKYIGGGMDFTFDDIASTPEYTSGESSFGFDGGSGGDGGGGGGGGDG